jgi:hypothetical protein
MEQADKTWRDLNRRWEDKTYFQWFVCLSATLFICSAVWLILSFTICPTKWRPFAVIASFVPILLWFVTMTWEQNEIWSYLFRLCFCGRCNGKTLQAYPLTQLNELLVDLGELPRTDKRVDVFDVPCQLSRAESVLTELEAYNTQLKLHLPQILDDAIGALPGDIRQIVIIYSILE